MGINPLYKFLSDMGNDGDSMGGRAFQAGRALWQDKKPATPYIPTGLSDIDISAVNAARLQQMPMKPRPTPMATPMDVGPGATPYIPTGLSDADIGAVNAYRASQAPMRQQMSQPEPITQDFGERATPYTPTGLQDTDIEAINSYRNSLKPAMAPQPEQPAREIGPQQPAPQPERQPLDVQSFEDLPQAQTTFYKRGIESGWDPRNLIAAMSQFAGEFGNLKGTPTDSSAPEYLKTMLGQEAQQRKSDLDLKEMEMKYGPKTADPEKLLKMELIKNQTEALKNKIQVDREMTDPESVRSKALKNALEIYMQKSLNAPGWKADPAMTGTDVYKWLGTLQFAIGQQNQTNRQYTDAELKLIAAEENRDFQAKQRELDRQAAMQRQQAGAQNQLQLKKTVPGVAPKAPGTAGAGKEKAATADQAARAEQTKQMMIENDNMTRILSNKDFDPTSRWYMGQMSLPLGAKHPSWQEYETVAFQFLEPILRKRTGAAVRDDELAKQMQQSFPMPGDNPETLKRKEVKRRGMIEEMKAWSGSAGTGLDTGAQQAPAQQGKPVRRIKSLNELGG